MPQAQSEKLMLDGLPVPLYHRVKTRLVEMLKAGTYHSGDIIPSEKELCDLFGVSRGTVRLAISELVQRGLLRKEQGRGTYVETAKLRNSLLTYFKFADRDSAEALFPLSRILKAQIIRPPKEVAVKLRLTNHELVVKLNRIRLVDHSPLIYQTSFFPEALFPGLETVGRMTQSLYKHLQERYGISVEQIEESLTARLPTPGTAQLLHIQTGDPVIVIERIAFALEHRPVEFRRSIGRADHYEYRVRLG